MKGVIASESLYLWNGFFLAAKRQFNRQQIYDISNDDNNTF